MAKWIGEYIPQNETYVEVFGGAFWVYVNGNIESKQIVYNDFNKYMANLFECFRTPQMFGEHLKRYESQNHKLFKMFQNGLNHIEEKLFDLGDYEIGSQYAYCATQVFSGSKVMESKFIDLKGKYSSKYDALQRRLAKPEVHDKMKRITKIYRTISSIIVVTFISIGWVIVYYLKKL